MLAFRFDFGEFLGGLKILGLYCGGSFEIREFEVLGLVLD